MVENITSDRSRCTQMGENYEQDHYHMWSQAGAFKARRRHAREPRTQAALKITKMLESWNSAMVAQKFFSCEVPGGDHQFEKTEI